MRRARASNSSGLGSGQRPLLSDRPLHDDTYDRFGYVDYAEALASIVHNQGTDTPLVMAINGRWGTGKTTLARMVERRLRDRPIQEGERPHITCWFDAWLHSDAPHLGAALAAEIARRVNTSRPLLTRLTRPLPAVVLRPQRRWRRRATTALASLFIASAAAAIPGVPNLLLEPPVLEDLLTVAGNRYLGILTVIAAAIVGYQRLFAFAEAAGRFIDDPSSEAAKGSMAEVKNQLESLVHQATRRGRRRTTRRLVVFIDNLERCQPARALEVCETASQLFGVEDAVTVLMTDMRMISIAAEAVYRGAPSPDGARSTVESRELGRLYSHKLVQIVLDMPRLTADDVRGMLVDPPADDVRSMVVDPPADHAQAPAGKNLQSRDRYTDRWRRRGRETAQAFWRVMGERTAPILAYVAIASTVVVLGNPVVLLALVAALVVAVGGTHLTSIIAAPLVLRRFRRDIDNTFYTSRLDGGNIEAVVTKQSAGSSRLEKFFLRLVGYDDPQLREALATWRFRMLWAQDSEVRRSAQEELLRHVPDRPREAKRLQNQLRLALAIVASPKNKWVEDHGRELGKWIALRERWPEAFEGILNDPGVLTKLEDPDVTPADVRRLMGDLYAPSELLELTELFKGAPGLCPLLPKLKRL
jgi:nicotinamide riboside kinase